MHRALQLIIRTMLFGLMLLALPIADGWALKTVEKDGLCLYFPDSEDKIAGRLLEKLPAIVAFLSGQGLAIRHPLHIVLDEDLDLPEVRVHMIPHREIRIPLRAPGAMEDGYTESDPWTYFLFRGLCMQGIFNLRDGIPAHLHRVFGEIVSPNIVLPEWILDGICTLLHKLYLGKALLDPLADEIFRTTAIPDLDMVSNHPELWPGHYGFRVYGRPFISWVYQNYGWDRLLDFILRHGRGIIPIEIDLKAKEAFGSTWSALWQRFKTEYDFKNHTVKGLHIAGYWPDPFIYWNHAGVYPGAVTLRYRGRYGFFDKYKTLWLSEYDGKGIAKPVVYLNDAFWPYDIDHVWDPGPGGVAVTRKGHRPYLMLLPQDRVSIATRLWAPRRDAAALIPGPPGAIQMSGPVMDRRGRIAVSANLGGNWDIWVYDGAWHRITTASSIEVDPWLEEDRLVFSSDISGRFQIHDAQMRPLTQCKTAAVLPRGQNYLCLATNGWQILSLENDDRTKPSFKAVPADTTASMEPEYFLNAEPYTPVKSIRPNYVMPDIFYDGSDLQLGIGTKSRDVTGDYTIDGGVRYASDTDFFSGRLGGKIKDVGGRVTRYPLSYTTGLNQVIDESRNEFNVFWTPRGIEEIELSLNGRTFKPLNGSGSHEDEYWGAAHLNKSFGSHRSWLNLDIFSEGSQSLFGGCLLRFGEKIHTSFHLQAGKTWGDLILGHSTYRIGGNVTEGYFTQRPTRLFPLRGFDSNIIEAGQAVTSGLEILWPLANLQAGYKTLPLYLHRLHLGTFVDAGAAGDRLSSDDILVGAGFELVTSLEIAWGNLSLFRMGVAWPLVQPGGMDQTGPLFLIQLGRPL
uniref:Bacterial surface antigen (D15) domain-containing protein n=1 Tax=Candidatus Desulfatibia profunda TaxID=2841695 RepID=A0A8J6TGV8_9BACT|nr:hypothetical protein [Candidatus Desulfatibia profunda]